MTGYASATMKSSPTEVSIIGNLYENLGFDSTNDSTGVVNGLAGKKKQHSGKHVFKTTYLTTIR